MTQPTCWPGFLRKTRNTWSHHPSLLAFANQLQTCQPIFTPAKKPSKKTPNPEEIHSGTHWVPQVLSSPGKAGNILQFRGIPTRRNRTGTPHRAQAPVKISFLSLADHGMAHFHYTRKIQWGGTEEAVIAAIRTHPQTRDIFSVLPMLQWHSQLTETGILQDEGLADYFLFFPRPSSFFATKHCLEPIQNFPGARRLECACLAAFPFFLML